MGVNENVKLFSNKLLMKNIIRFKSYNASENENYAYL